MISDIIKAVEFVINVARGMNSPSRKREKLAKHLLDIYRRLRLICDRSARIVDLVAGDSRAPRVVAARELLEQQAALRELVTSLHQEPVKSLITLYVPDFGNFAIVAAMKVERLGFFLAALFSDAEAARTKDLAAEIAKSLDPLTDKILMNRRQRPLTDEEKALVLGEALRFKATFAGGSVHGFDPSKLSDDEVLALLENSSDHKLLTSGRAAKLDAYQQAESFLVYRQSPESAPVRVFATPDQLTEAQQTVSQLEDLCRSLRQVLLEHFTVADLI